VKTAQTTGVIDMKTIVRLLLVALAALTALLPAGARADGFIIIAPEHPIIWPPPPMPPHPHPHPIPIPRHRPHPVYAPLEVSYHHVEAKIDDQIARTEIDQEFINPTSARLEGYYMFPLPKGAQIDRFSMWIDGKEIHAELLPADKARGIYEDIVRRSRDPALLEYVGRDMFRARIFPIEPHSKKRVKIAYAQLLKSENDTVEYLYPLNTEKFSAKPLHNVSVKVEIASKQPLLNVYSPTHNIDVRRRDDHHAAVGFEERDTRPDLDFQLFFSRKKTDVGVSLLTFKPERSDDGYFLLLASPRWAFGQAQIAEKDVVFVADTSGSMAGPKLDQLKRALQFCIASLNAGDRFEIVRFSTEAEPLFSSLRRADRDAQTEARKFVDNFRAAGGTAIDEALQKALRMKATGATRPFIVVFLTDGRPTIGETDEDRIVSRTRNTDATTRIFTFGVGTDINTHLLDRLTEETRAASQYVLPEEDIEVKVSSFFDKIRDPVMTNVEVKFSGGARVTKLYPSAIPDLFKGEQLILFGRYSGSGDTAVTITGNVGGVERKFVFEQKFEDRTDEHPFIARLWATRRVGYLLDEIRLRGESGELRDEVIQLAREHGIVTPYTAYLIVEDERRRVAANEIREDAQTLVGALKDERSHAEAKAQWEGYALGRSSDAMKGGWRGVWNSENTNQLKGAHNYAQQMARAVPTAPAEIATRTGREQLRGDAPVAIDLAQQVRVVRGKTFYQNGVSWVDADVQKQANAKRVQVKFNSREYFELLTQIPRAATWLALGQNVQFTHGNTVYEIID
jgi:Ca-activated chloride channel family protein